MKRFLIIMGFTALLGGAIFLTLFVKTTSANADIAAGNQAYAAQDYATALQRYSAAQAQAPAQTEPIYNAANAYYRQNELEQAQQTLEPTLSHAPGALAEFVHFNLGNIAYSAQKFDEAIAQYEAALRLQPHDRDAKYNLELALQQKQQQDQQNQQQQDQQQQNQDQQQQNQQDQQNQSGGQQDQQKQQQDQQGQQPQDQQQDQPGEQPQDQPQGQPGDQQPADQKEGQAAGAQPQKGLTPEQAKRLLAVIGGNSKTLMEKLQWMYVTAGRNPDKDW